MKIINKTSHQKAKSKKYVLQKMFRVKNWIFLHNQLFVILTITISLRSVDL